MALKGRLLCFGFVLHVQLGVLVNTLDLLCI